MGAPRGLTLDDLRAFALAKAELVARQGWAPHPDRAQAIKLIGKMIDQSTSAPLVFRRGPRGWMLGIGEGERLAPPSDEIGEALRVLHAALTAPLTPQEFRGGLNAARINVTRARQLIDEHCPELAALLRRVRVTQDDSGSPVATYRPPAHPCPLKLS
jgi:hypothetical protein